MKSASMAIHSIILLLVLSISCPCSTRDVYILPSEGEHCPGTPCYNVTTFGKIADSFSKSSGLVVHFLEGTHLLDLQEVVKFTNLTNAVFEGDGRMEQGFHETVWQSTVVIKCTKHSSTGIAFVNSANITFRYITITNCGAILEDSLTDTLYFASLGYLNVSNIVIDHISVQNGSGCGLLIITFGANVSIASSSFARNGRVINPNIPTANVRIEYTPISGGDPQKGYVYNTLITHSNISHLQSSSPSFSIYGLYLGIYQTSYSVTIVLDSVKAYNNENTNIAIFSINCPNYNLTINNSHSSNTKGAALKVDVSDSFGLSPCYGIPRASNISIVNSKFIYSKSKYKSVEFQFKNVDFSVTIMIKSTEISHNIFGQNALYVASYAYQDLVKIVLQDVTLNNNSYNSTLTPLNSSSPLSTVCTEFVTLVLNSVSITNSNATGLLAYRTVIMINTNSTSIFHVHNNTGIDGGGLAMYGDSYLMFQNNSLLNFTNNKAQRGGAIFVYTLNSAESPCFYQYVQGTLPLSTKAYFTGNNAETAGSVLFGGNQNCLLFNIPYINFTQSHVYFNETFNYSAQTGPSVISSEPAHVCFCGDNNTINCSQTQLTMTAYPGEEINISVVTVGQENGVSPGLITIESKGSVHAKAETYKTIPMNCTSIAFNPIAVNYSITITTDRSSFISRSVMLNINKTDCPLGFQISNETGACDCTELTQKASSSLNLKCDAATNTISRQGDVWIGNISDCVIVHSPCPLDYCNTQSANFSFTDPDPQCALKRSEILCGGCSNNFSLALGSNKCIPCPDPFHLALIIPFAAAGLGLVALLTVLNLTVSIGTINGLIFYASIVKISESNGIFFPNGPVPVLSQFIAWLNLDLGIETCFYHGMTAYHKVWLQFVFPLYIWFIIATIIVLCRYSRWLSRKIGGNVVQVLATLILLSFTKIFRTFAPALTWVELSCEVNITTVWYMDGNVPYFSTEHYILMAAAVLFLLLAVPYTLALLFDVVIEKYLTRIAFFRRRWIKFKPLIDAYHGPYKDNCRFWTGLLLLVRMSFTLVSLHLDTFGTLIFITTSSTVLLSLLVIFEGVYQKKYLNILECLSFLNLGLLSALAAVYQNNDFNEQVITIVSISAALVTFIGILLFHTIQRFCKNTDIKCCSKKEEEYSLLVDEEGDTDTDHSVPTFEVCMRRESLIY